jgi:hypothetical protein
MVCGEYLGCDTAYKLVDVSEKPTTSTFRVDEEDERTNSKHKSLL